MEAAEKENSARQKEVRTYVTAAGWDVGIMAVLSCLQLKKCHEELNKRIYEHDKLVAEGSDKTDITLKVRT